MEACVEEVQAKVLPPCFVTFHQTSGGACVVYTGISHGGLSLHFMDLSLLPPNRELTKDSAFVVHHSLNPFCLRSA